MRQVLFRKTSGRGCAHNVAGVGQRISRLRSGRNANRVIVLVDLVVGGGVCLMVAWGTKRCCGGWVVSLRVRIITHPPSILARNAVL